MESHTGSESYFTQTVLSTRVSFTMESRKVTAAYFTITVTSIMANGNLIEPMGTAYSKIAQVQGMRVTGAWTNNTAMEKKSSSEKAVCMMDSSLTAKSVDEVPSSGKMEVTTKGCSWTASMRVMACISLLTKVVSTWASSRTTNCMDMVRRLGPMAASTKASIEIPRKMAKALSYGLMAICTRVNGVTTSSMA